MAVGHSDSIFRAMTDNIHVSKMYWHHVAPQTKPITFPEAFYMAAPGGGTFFGKTGNFEEGNDFYAVVLDDTSLVHPQELTVTERLERAVYPGLDRNGIRAKFAVGEQIAL